LRGLISLRNVELARAEGVVARVDLVAECLADLCDAKGDLVADGGADVAELGEDALRRFGAEIGDV